ncbi:GAF domain-containing protein [Novosphingobium sp. ZN18A2]|uniref:GAF domain-containing protein n=1 Tax=Novosphingobium sp. ZN18A2 TaxID=3079861 RepID=UPI0030D41C33
MYDFKPAEDAPKAETYRELAASARALVEGEADPVANMANIAALIWQFVPRLNWAGFYRTAPGELVLGPFIGKPACIRIPLGQGVCGTAAQSGQTQLVEDVHAFPGHIACDAESASELVVPVRHDGMVVAVIDLDSPETNRFDAEDAAGIEALARAVAAHIAGG